MKVLLISANRTRSPYPVYPLGVDYVAGALASRHQVRILDMNLLEGPQELEAAIGVADPDVVGISIRNIDNVDALSVRNFVPDYERLVRRIRACSDARIVLGGSGFSIFPEALMALLGADFGILGEGEAMALLLSTLERGESPAGLPGVVTPGGDFRVPDPWIGPLQRAIGRLDDRLPFYLERGGILNLQTKRGCPFCCIYCTYPHIDGRRLRLGDPDTVAREARALQELGARYLFITDSVFNADEAHSLAVAEAFRRQGVTVPWGAFFAPISPSEGYYGALAEAGLAHVEFGTESLCEDQLKRYGKPFGVREILAADGMARREGIPIAHYFLLGGPGEEGRTVDETLDGMDRLGKAVFFFFCGMRIFPHTPLYRLALAEGRIGLEEDLLSPCYYLSEGIGTEAILARVEARARGRANWVFGDGGEATERIVARMHARGHTGPLWELLLR